MAARKPRDSPTELKEVVDQAKQILDTMNKNGVSIPMATAKVNFAAVADFEAIPEGEYECVFSLRDDSRGGPIAPSKKGQPTLYAEYLVQDTNQKIFKSYSLQPTALWALKRDLMRLGADPEEMNSENADLDDILQPLVGSTCTVVTDEPVYYPLNADGTPAPDAKLQTNFKEVKDPTKL